MSDAEKDAERDCTCPEALCLGVPGDSEGSRVCRACMALDPEEDCIRERVIPSEKDAACVSAYDVPTVGPLRCLLRAPHPSYRHYTADSEHPERFWTWTAEDPRATDYQEEWSL